jgi:hypothetical protein
MTNRKKGKRTNGKLVLGVSIGLVVGLVLGISISVFLNLGSIINPTGTGIGNQVQVSGTVKGRQTGTIVFVNLNKTIQTSAPITDGKYSVLLVGGQSYDVAAGDKSTGDYSTYKLYVPSGVATFTADF